MSRVRAAVVFLVVLGCPLSVRAEPVSSWQQPPQAILDVLHAPELPTARLSPTGDVLALMRPLRYPPIADRAQPVLKLAGVRVNPLTNGVHGEITWVDLVLKQVADGREQAVALPTGARILSFSWAADGSRFALLNQAAESIELWIGETENGSIRRIPDLRINPLLESAITWMPDQRTLLVKRIPPERGAPPAKPQVPSGPKVRECSGESASSTYEARDLLTGPEDEALFAYYTLSQLALVDTRDGRVTPVGEPDLMGSVEPSPSGGMILVERLHKPWSYACGWTRFPRDVEVWDRQGKTVFVLAHLPLADQVPIHGVSLGPRDYSWRPTEPATLTYLEALDGGDPMRKVPARDRLMLLKQPFKDAPREIYRAAHRVESLWWGEQRSLALIEEYERERRWRYIWGFNADRPASHPVLLYSLSANDRYGDPGHPVTRQRRDGGRVLAQDGDAIFFTGQGASPGGERPFLDRFSLHRLQSERLFRSDPSAYEVFVGWLDLRAATFLTRHESPREVPNYIVRALAGKAAPAGKGEAAWKLTRRPLTDFPDPAPQLREIHQRIVTYKRADGTPLSFTLYLPPGYQEGTRLPTVIEAYPLEFSDPATAGQVTGTDRGFVRFLGPTPLFFLLDGYAVLEDVSMPVIGDPDTAYDTFIEQLVASAKAAIAKAVEIGVTDSARVGVIGHSHGALMTATLLAHSSLFKAGIARSGAYNHTLRPFGFQSERRTLWQAPDTYIRLSPLMSADKIRTPILLIHGADDQNPGTVPLQSEKLFEAIRGTGGTARLVMLPLEGHGYQSREAVEDVLAEQLAWFGRYLKNAPLPAR